jgi:tetratricopeptide (TPR) repeat protein
MVVVLALGAAAVAWSRTDFDFMDRCTDPKQPPDKRIGYCTHVLNEGGGPNSEIGLLIILGAIHRDLREYDTAIALYNRAIGYQTMGTSKHDESLPSPSTLAAAFAARAETYALTGKAQSALADAEQIFKLEPNDAYSYAFRCRIRAILNVELETAHADCDAAMKKDSRNAQVFDAAGFLQYRMGHWKDAATDYDSALGFNARLAGALFMRGVIKRHDGDATGGDADIARAKDRDPAIADRFAAMGVTP